MPFTHSMVPPLSLFSPFPTARRPSLRNTVRTPASFVSRELGRTECSQWINYFNPMPLQHYPPVHRHFLLPFPFVFFSFFVTLTFAFFPSGRHLYSLPAFIYFFFFFTALSTDYFLFLPHHILLFPHWL